MPLLGNLPVSVVKFTKLNTKSVCLTLMFTGYRDVPISSEYYTIIFVLNHLIFSLFSTDNQIQAFAFLLENNI